MTTEADNNDSRVTEAYREVANERTPAELDRKVLAMAAAEAQRPRGLLPRTWFRPLAWAATIALSFALIMEISQIDNAALDDVAAPRTDADQAESSAPSMQLPAETAAKQEDEARVQQQFSKRSADAPAAAKAALAEGNLLREAEEQDRLRSEQIRALGALVESKEQANGCSEEAREAAESWYECVQTLRDAGQTDLARHELEALQAEFPDFREPPGDE